MRVSEEALPGRELHDEGQVTNDTESRPAPRGDELARSTLRIEADVETIRSLASTGPLPRQRGRAGLWPLIPKVVQPFQPRRLVPDTIGLDRPLPMIYCSL